MHKANCFSLLRLAMRASALSILVALVASIFVSAQPATEPRIAQAKKRLEPRLLSLPLGKYTVAQFLSQLQTQTGNVVLDRRQTRNDAPVALELNKVAFWEALDRFSAVAGCGYTAYGSDGAVILTDAAGRSPQVSYHGITRTELKRIAVARDFESGTSTCTVQLDVAWEPRFQPFYFGAGPASATFAPGATAKELKVQAPSRGQVAVAGRSASALELHLPGPERSAPMLVSLAGRFTLLGPSKMLTFRFPKIKAQASQEQEEVAVRLTSVKEGLDRWLVEVQIDNPEGTPAFESFQTWLDNNRIWLVRGEPGKEKTWLPEPNEAVLHLEDRKAVVQYAFAAPQGRGKISDWTLVYRTPGRIVELVVPYRFEKVPLP
jgi:hypothetical protein